MTTSASLPMTRRIWPQARAEPMPSPSGRACEVTTKRRRARISCRTRSSICSSSSCQRRDCPVSLCGGRRGKLRLNGEFKFPLRGWAQHSSACVSSPAPEARPPDSPIHRPDQSGNKAPEAVAAAAVPPVRAGHNSWQRPVLPGSAPPRPHRRKRVTITRADRAS